MSLSVEQIKELLTCDFCDLSSIASGSPQCNHMALIAAAPTLAAELLEARKEIGIIQRIRQAVEERPNCPDPKVLVAASAAVEAYDQGGHADVYVAAAIERLASVLGDGKP